MTARPQRSHTLRPLPGADGGTDALAHAFGHGRVELGVNMAAVAVPPDHRTQRNRRRRVLGSGAVSSFSDTEAGVDEGDEEGDEDNDPAVRDCVLYFGVIDFLRAFSRLAGCVQCAVARGASDARARPVLVPPARCAG